MQIWKKATAILAAVMLACAPALADQSDLAAPTTGSLSGINLVNDYNAALNAVNTCNSGASAPSNQLSGSPSAGNCWYNTSTGAVSYYDGTAWLPIGYIDTTNHVWTPAFGGGAATSVASATTTNLCGSSGAAPQQSALTITGTTTIASFGSNCVVGQIKVLTFAGAAQITYNSVSMILPTGASFTTSAGDVAIAINLSGGNWRILYFAASGYPLAEPPGVVVPWAITGGLPSSMTGTNATAAMSVSGVTASDQTGVTVIGFSGSKSWSVTNGNAIGGYAGGATLPNSSTIHMFDCHGASGDGVYATTTAPGTFVASSCPTGYAVYTRRLFSFTTNSSGAPTPYNADEVTSGGYVSYLATQTLDITGSSTTGSRTLYALNVPTGIKVEWLGRVADSANYALLVTSPDETDVAVGSYTAAPSYDMANSGVIPSNQGSFTLTNTSAQVGVRTITTNTLYGVTRGWVDFRRS